MIEATLKSNITNRVIKSSYTARQLLDFFDEEELVLDMGKCDCQPVGETNVIDCGCYEEWEDYTLVLGEAREEVKRLKEENKQMQDDITEAISIWECMDMEDDSIDTIERVIEKLKQALQAIDRIQEGRQG